MSSEHATAASTAVSNNELKEMAYLILEDCRVEVISEVGDFQPHLKLPLRQWIQVSQLGNSTVLENQDCRTKCRKFVGTTENQLPFDGTCCCRRCNLVLLHQSTAKESLMLQLDWEQVPPFRGTISDVFPVTKGPPFASLSCSCPVAAAKAQRSDAALMAGLLVACREQITVIHCSVLFREDNQASLLWTLAFPHLQRQTTVANTTTRRSILFQQQPSVGLKTKIRSRIVYKPLDPALQLLLSLVRSDWDQLEVYQQRLTHREVVGDALPPRTKKPSFFPPKLTLGELYHRTQSSSSTNSMHHHRNGTRSRNKKVTQNDACLLISLPLEVLVEKMSPFLNAQSLAGLITSCIYLNRSLQGVVPGLKLRLYSHQITSLSWMRRREASLLRAETDCLKIKQPFQNCDVHRSITGGATVRLASKPNESYECNVRLDTYTGREIAPDPEFCNNESLPRRLAHGGLLCDDPGLGKTVTVLALILQTCGLSTASETKPSSTLSTTRSATLRKDSQSLHVSTELNNNSENDAIFRAYWAEHVVAEFRGPALLKLVNELGKKNRGGGSFPLEEVQQAITDDKYGANFSAFELGVE